MMTTIEPLSGHGEMMVRDELLCMFSDDTAKKKQVNVPKKIHWSTIVERFVEPKVGIPTCTRSELIMIMNELLMPYGNMRGSDHWFWFE